MERNRLLMIGALLAAVVVVAGGFLLGVKPRLDAASSAQATQATVSQQNRDLETSIAALKKQSEGLDAVKAELATLQESVPAGVESGALITELNKNAAASGVSLDNIAFGAAAAYTAPQSAASTSTSATATDSASPAASDSASPTATPTSTTPASPTVATSSLITASNFTTIPVTIAVQGSYAQALAFLQGLRDGDRLVLVNSITSAEATSDGSTDSTTTSTNTTTTLNWTFAGFVYALTDAATAQQAQQSTTSTAAGTSSTDGSSTDTAAGK